MALAHHAQARWRGFEVRQSHEASGYSAPGDPILEAHHVSKDFGDVPVLSDVSFSIRPGEVLVVRGANGTGKSTLLRCLSGWDRFDSGSVSFLGATSDPESAIFRHGVASALGRVMTSILADDTELFKQFSDNESFKRWLTESIFNATYKKAR